MLGRADRKWLYGQLGAVEARYLKGEVAALHGRFPLLSSLAFEEAVTLLDAVESVPHDSTIADITLPTHRNVATLMDNEPLKLRPFIALMLDWQGEEQYVDSLSEADRAVYLSARDKAIHAKGLSSKALSSVTRQWLAKGQGKQVGQYV